MKPLRSFEEQIERQVRRWEVERRAAIPEPAPPCVALSRLPASGGAELGQRAADKLDYGFFGSEIVDQIAREHGIQRRLLAGLDEHVRTLIERYVTDAFRPGTLTESDYLRHVVRVMTTLGERGRAVILGRGAPFILSPERALRVLVVAPTPARGARLAAERGISREQAAEHLARADAERRAFLGHHFRVAPDDPTLYDLVVNTETLGMDLAVALVVETLQARFRS